VRLNLLLLFLAFTINSYAQSFAEDSLKNRKSVTEQAREMAAAFLNHDYKTFIDYTHPRIIELIGNVDDMISKLQSDSAFTNSILSVSFGKPSNIIANGDLFQCTLPETTEILVDKGRLVNQSTLVAISYDGGIHWYFIEAAGKTLSELRNFIPEISDQLVIPTQHKPVLYKKRRNKN